MKNYHILFIGIIVILLVGGGVLIYNDLTKSSVSKNVIDNQENQNINNEAAKSTVKDCGLIEDMNVDDLFTSNPLANTSDQTKVSLKCMDDALTNCQLAKMKLVIKEEGEGVYEIKGKEGQNCLINGPFGKTKAYQTCRISPDVITETKTALKQGSDSNGLMFFTIILQIGMNAMFVPSDFIGSSYPIGPVETINNDATGKTTTSFYNYDCR